ncbi:RNA polymerase sigma factor [Patulibacter minatonensis]|uniref:RNA polymerase sigma factor n=1 Tax=Patulibacter minatonensis TaxID=298163 RepID=UPI0004B4F33F|nr:sigma-70 family RNA polymerase sigma factor [Patulibacter minatonensis]
MSENPTRGPGSGDAGRWAVYDEHHAAVHRYVARRADPAAVEDLTAETFAIAWRRLPRASDDPLPWLYAVARRVVHGHRRSTARRAALVRKLGRAGEDRTAGGDPHDRVAGDPRLVAAFATLSAKEQEALALVAWEGLDHDRAARAAGCSPGTFAVRLSRGRTRLRAALAEPDDAPDPSRLVGRAGPSGAAALGAPPSAVPTPTSPPSVAVRATHPRPRTITTPEA